LSAYFFLYVGTYIGMKTRLKKLPSVAYNRKWKTINLNAVIGSCF
jgi:hypothetical protein